MKFEWVPGQGIRQEALERMKQHFHKPEKPPYEAWFMSEINYHTFFLEYAPDELDAKTVRVCLEDYSGGIRNFGRFEEWVLWYQYLLPFMLPRFGEAENLLPTLINYFINLYTRGIIQSDIGLPEEIAQKQTLRYFGLGLVEEYPGFRDDILNTLAQAIMESVLWENGDLSKTHSWYIKEEEWDERHLCPLYASLFFCLMYLTPEEIVTWVASIAAIQGEVWNTLIKDWLAGVKRFFHFVAHPETIWPEDIPRRYKDDWKPGKEITLQNYLEIAGIAWARSWGVFNGPYASRDLNDYIPAVNIETFWQEIQKYPNLALPDSLS
jgi:hypothetical protein